MNDEFYSIFLDLCVPAEECTDFLDARAMLEKLDKSTPEYTELLKELRDLVCDKLNRRICCEGKLINEIMAGNAPGSETM